MADLRPVTCCFSGYRIEKMPFRNEDCPAARELFAALDAAVAEAAADGCTRFLSGMSTGFDLWAAEAVLRRSVSARVETPVQPLPARRRQGVCALAELSRRVLCRAQPVYGGCIVKAHLLL